MIKKKKKEAVIAFRMTPEFKRMVEREANKRGRNLSVFITEALQNEMVGYREVILKGSDKDFQRTVDAFVRSAQKPKHSP
jgi:uncharacterized protein (DUF1778 family)